MVCKAAEQVQRVQSHTQNSKGQRAINRQPTDEGSRSRSATAGHVKDKRAASSPRQNEDALSSMQL